MEKSVQPSSPGVSPVLLDNCIEELLKLTLASSIDGTLEIDLGLSKEYCSDLLKHDLDGHDFNPTGKILDFDTLWFSIFKLKSNRIFRDTVYVPRRPRSASRARVPAHVGSSIPLPPSTSTSADPSLPLSDLDLDLPIAVRKDTLGVPPYPLYKHLASALHQCITSGAFCRTSNILFPIHEGSILKQKERNKMVLDKGSELVNMLKAVQFELHVQEPFFSQLRVGLKTIEGRCAVGDYTRIGPGALILFNKCLLLEVQDVKWYASFSEMLEAESLLTVLPGVSTTEEGLQIYRKFYTEDKERSNGVLAICVSRPTAQPYICLASILSELGYEGVQSFLGMIHTEGTIPEALPPPRSALLSSFLMPHKPNVR
ncbi:hypothetical protein HHK36_019956 [Tetracentron sinense]|uniref:ASCH domain-containing protein n=1 Tax=Tetracentron sinense TaxID=13715 RepID=A0A834YWB8_TETSI|nr:hypothetical protein HHK36_019956 [Tetracentron sinense]